VTESQVTSIVFCAFGAILVLAVGIFIGAKGQDRGQEEVPSASDRWISRACYVFAAILATSIPLIIFGVVKG